MKAFLATDGAVDRWTACRLLLPMAVAGRASILRTVEATDHPLTNPEVIRRFPPLITDIDAGSGSPATVRVTPRQR